MFRQSDCRIIGRLQQKTVQQIFHRKLFETFQVYLLAAAGDLGLNALRAGDDLIHFTVFNGHQRGDDLGKGAGSQLHIGVIGIDDRSGVGFIGKGRLRRCKAAL